jgi:hypothetical protein
MKRGLSAVLASVVLFGTLAGLAMARSTTSVAMNARLTVTKLAAATLPNASGHFSGTLLRFGNGRSKLTWSLTTKSLGGVATQAQLVIPATKKNPGQVSVQLCKPCRVSSHGVVNPILKASTRALFTRPGYVIVYTKKYKAGAIRGSIVRH